MVYEKHRETWRLERCDVCLDELPRLGWYVEIEGSDATAVGEVRRQLGLHTRPMLRETYVELAATHGFDDRGCRRLVFNA